MTTRALAALLTLMLATPALAAPQPSLPDQARAQAQIVRDNEALIGELSAMGAVDQLIRLRFLALRKNATAEEREALDVVWASDYRPFDVRHTARLKQLLAGRGWFRLSEVGDKPAAAAFHMVQHSSDLEFQKQALGLMEPLLKDREIDGSYYAMLYDRIATAEKRPQRYGTQGTTCDGGRYAVPSDLEDPSGLDARRAAANLPPMAEYLKSLDTLYGACSN